MPRQLVPPLKFERFTAAGGLVFLAIGAIQLRYGEYLNAGLSAVAVVLSIINAYILQTPAKDVSEVDEYAKVISQISFLSGELGKVGTFLEREQSRIAQAEETVAKLRTEQSKLEPVVATQRATVEAILAAHANRTVLHAWKERMFSFSLGVIASIIASFIYEYLRR